MAELVILAAIEVGLALANSALTQKPKTQAVDRGRLDDLRVQTAEEGAHIPICFGRQVRLAGVIVDGEATREYKTTTPGRTGGKGGGGGGEGPVTNFGYKKTFAILGGVGPIKSFLQIKETTGSGTETIFDLRPSPVEPSSVYEAEASANTLAGGALIVDDITMSGGRRVSLPAGAAVTFTGVRGNFTQTYQLNVYYVSSALGSLGVKINSGSESTHSLPSSGGVRADFTIDLTVPSGNSNTIRLKNLGASTISIDSIFFFAELPDEDRVTGVIHPSDSYPADLHRPNPFYNYAPAADGAGATNGTFAAGGQSPFELYLGTEDQLQSPTLVALHGADHVSAMRGFWYIVANQYEVKNGQLGNFTFTIEPMIQDLGKILEYLYLETNQADPDDLDFSRVEGTIVEGMIYDRGDPIGAYVDALSVWYGFDIVPCGGKITAIPRGGASIVSIPAIDLFAREEGSEMPHGALAIDHLNDLEISGAVDVLYSDISETKDFHTGKQHYSRELANTGDPETLSVPIVGDADTAHAVAKRVVWEKILTAKPSEWSTGPKYRYLLPTDVVTLTADDATYVHRIISAQRAQSGLVKFKSVPEKGAIYSQVGAGIVGSGQEIPPVAFPPNTFLALLDLPPLRLEDDKLGYYVAACPYGAQGRWRGAILYKEEIEDIYDRLTAFERAATIGVLAADLPGVANPSVFDRDNEIVLDLLHDDGLFESHTESEIIARPLNLLVLGSGYSANVVQFCNATYEAPTAPYVARVRLSTLLHGRAGTDAAAIEGSVEGATAVLFNDSVKFRQEDPAEIGAARNFKAASVGQALADAPVTSFTFQGFSKKPLSPVNVIGARDSDDNLFIKWTRRSRVGGGLRSGADVPLGEESNEFIVESLELGGPTELREWNVLTGMALAALLESDGIGKFDSVNVNSLIVLSGSFARARSLQEITQTGNFVEATLRKVGGSQAAGIGLISSAKDWRSAAVVFDYFARVENIPSTLHEVLKFYVGGVEVYSENVDASYADGIRVRLSLSGSEVRFTKNWAGPGTPPLYVSPVAPTYPLRAFAQAGGVGASSVEKVVMSIGPTAATIYTAAQQTEDGLTPGDPVHLKISQLSSLVGRGLPADVTV